MQMCSHLYDTIYRVDVEQASNIFIYHEQEAS